MPAASTRRVAILPNTVADQIAAGEVVERPASALKELVENALDAGARHIRISLENGGKTAIEVADDGSGMSREDAVLALDRHATSKIASAADLVGVATFGFRGEALPAIASVARFTLVTAEEQGEATEISVTGGRIDRVAPAARQQGTTVTVRGLFFNTPARRKFLRSVSSEARASWETVATLALAHPRVGFEMVIDGRTRLAVPPDQEPDARLSAVWGEDLVRTLVPVQWAQGRFRISGYLQRPGDAHPTGRRVQLFINSRPFRDPFLVRAAEAGYRSAIHPGDRPSLFLQIATDAGEVDVNVHPAKLEVRFRDRLGLERALEEAVRDALGTLAAAAPVGVWDGLVPAGSAPPREFLPGPDAAPIPVPDLFGSEHAQDAPATAPPEPRAFEAPLIQLFDTYIVFETGTGVVIVDQHAAHERVLYEEVMTQLTNEAAAAQRLLLPIMVELTDEEMEVVEQHRAALERVGFDVEPFGGRTIVLHTVPAPHPRFDATACFQELVADLARGRFGGWANGLERFAATFACRAAVKAGMVLSDREMRELLLRLFATALPPHDVHGRATIVQLPRDELERRFGRR
ncbi:MAG TPA: DNA mismatch repair endonuclease MutL [Gemmatimonadales bacterium]|nr:DNA mismatch repair endonuclease MutL [Gemmatimonadales bacterium]